MLESLAFFFKSVSITSLIIMFIGLIEPWWVLWFEAMQNRLKVIKVYGTTALICWLLGYIFSII